MVYLFLADGFEDIEAVQTRDLLIRAGVEVKTVGIGSKNITSAFGLPVEADISENDIDMSKAEGIIFPGGLPGTNNLKASKTVSEAIGYALEHDLVIGAICAAPGAVLKGTGALFGKRYTCFPGWQVDEGTYTAEKSVTDGDLITANGPAAAAEFAVRLAEKFASADGAEKIRNMYK